MFTVCPKCALTLVVTAADLRIAQGYVRCGRCSSVFNALARLTDDRQAAESLSEAQQPSVPEEPRPPTTAESASAQPAGSTESSARGVKEEVPVEGEVDAPRTAQTSAAETSGAAEFSTSPTPAHSEYSEYSEYSEHPEHAEHAPPASAGATEESLPESALEFDPSKTDVTAVFVEPPPHPEWTAATGSFKALIASAQAEGPVPDVPASDVPGPNLPGPPVPQQSVSDASASAAPAERVAESARTVVQPPRGAEDARAKTEVSPATRPRAPARDGTLHGRPPSAAAARVPVSVRRRTATPKRKHDPAGHGDSGPEMIFGKARVQARPPARSWSVGVGLAAFVLCAQVVHHYRDELAASAGLNRPLTALYAALGMPLVPRLDLHAYDVRQLGASVDPSSAGLITVRASIKNGAPQPQPLPLLRVTLQDRFGNHIAARDVTPHSYLPRTTTPSSFLAAGQRIDAEMGFVDPGATAVGFEIDACLPARGGVTCANDSATR